MNTSKSGLSAVRAEAIRPSKLEAFGARVRDWGVRRALYFQLMNPLRNYLGFAIHYVGIESIHLDSSESECPDVPVGYDTRLAGLTDMLPYAGRVSDLSKELLEQRFEQGDECVANFFGAELVGFSFISRVRTRATDQLDAIVPAGFRYSYKSWTHEDHRRKNLGRMRTHVRVCTAQRPFQERSIWYVETHNYASLLHSYAHPRKRAISMGFVGWFTLFGRQIPFSTRRAKWVGFELRRREDTTARQYV